MTEKSRFRGMVGASTAVLSRASRARSARGAARRERLRLARELAAYRTPAERLELDIILGRHTAEETRQIEEILRDQDALRSLADRPIGVTI